MVEPVATDQPLPNMNTHFAVTLAALLPTVGVYAATVAHYEFNGTGLATVGSTITDLVGGHDGTVAGGDLVYGTDLMVGGYLSFAADAGAGNPGNRVEIPGSADFVFTLDQAYTFEAIFRTTQITTNGVIFSKGCDVSNPDSQWWLRHQGNGQLRIDIEGVDNTTEDNATSANTTLYNDGLWHSVAAVFDGTQATKSLNIYVDGVLTGTDTSGILTLGLVGGTDADPVIFGEYATLPANRSFAGDLAAIRFSNTALSTVEFLQVPEPTLPALLIFGLVGGWSVRRRFRQ